MTTIGITVSNTRAFPSQLEEIKQFNKFILIKPGELEQKIDRCDIIYVWNLAYEELEACLINKTAVPKSIFIARQGVDSELIKLAHGKNLEIQYARGVFSDSIGEFILASVFMLSKNLHTTVMDRSWIKQEQLPVSGSTALLLGRGDISSVSKNLFQKMNINTKQIGKLEVAKIARGDVSSDDQSFLEQVDHIICCLPLKTSTENILNDTFFSYFSNANFINVSRGGVLNTNSLLRALDKRSLRAAALDAFKQEPLPQDSELWSDSRIVISPHQSYKSPNWEYLLHTSFINFVKSHDTIDINRRNHKEL